MRKKINIIQFMPYFPPHKGGVEAVGKDIGHYWVKNDLGIFINVITSFEQNINLNEYEKIIFDNLIIGYKENNVINLVIPSYEIVNNFPNYKNGKIKKAIYKYLDSIIDKKGVSNVRILTHTRFFLTSLYGGIFAKKRGIKWVHIEHGGDYVKLTSKVKTYISYFYDKTLGKWVFNNTDILLAISDTSKEFVSKKFKNNNVSVFYRGLEVNDSITITEDLKKKFGNKMIIGFIGRLYKCKNVLSLIKAFKLLDENYKKDLALVIVGDGEEYERLKSISNEKNIYLTGGKSFEEALAYQRQFDIYVHPSSKGGGLATTLLQAMYFGLVIVATPYEGASDVIVDGENGILVYDDSVDEIKQGIIKAIKVWRKNITFSEENKKIISNKFLRDNNIFILYDFIK